MHNILCFILDVIPYAVIAAHSSANTKRGRKVIETSTATNFSHSPIVRTILLQFSGPQEPKFCHSRYKRWGRLPPYKPIGNRPASPRDSPADITYNLNNVCDAGASPVPSPVDSAPRFSGECIMYQLQMYGSTIQRDCQD